MPCPRYRIGESYIEIFVNVEFLCPPTQSTGRDVVDRVIGKKNPCKTRLTGITPYPEWQWSEKIRQVTRSKFQPPPSNGPVRNIDAELGQQILDNRESETESGMASDGMIHVLPVETGGDGIWASLRSSVQDALKAVKEVCWGRCRSPAVSGGGRAARSQIARVVDDSDRMPPSIWRWCRYKPSQPFTCSHICPARVTVLPRLGAATLFAGKRSARRRSSVSRFTSVTLELNAPDRVTAAWSIFNTGRGLSLAAPRHECACRELLDTLVYASQRSRFTVRTRVRFRH